MIAPQTNKTPHRHIPFRGQRWILGIGIILVSTRLSAQTKGAQADAALTKGVQMLREGHAAEAMPALNAAVSSDPRSVAALTWRGICENQIGSYQAAAKDLRAAVRLDATALSAHYNLALSLIRLKEIDPAIAQLQTVVTLQPEAVAARYNLAVLLEQKKQISEAVEQLRQAHASAEADAGVSLHLLEDLLQLREVEQVPALVEDLTRDSVPIAVQREAGGALLQAKRFNDAATLLERARAREPNGRQADLLVARAYVGEGKNAEAIALLTASPGAQTDEETVYTAGLAYLGMEDTSSAAAAFEKAATLDPKDDRPLYHLALLAERSRGGEAKAEELLRRALQLDPGDRPSSLAMARLLLATDKAEAAKMILTAMRPEPTDDVERSTLLGVAFASNNEMARAIPELQHAHTLDPQLALAANVLGFCYFRGGDYVRAAEAYHLASDLEPSRLLYARDAAIAYQRASAETSALHYAERAALLPAATASDDALLGKLYAKEGRQEDAIRLLRRAAEADPGLDSALYLLARIYQRIGNPEEAAQWNKRLQAAKERHEATFAQEKKRQAAVQSSQVLSGGTLSDDTGDVE